MARIKWTRPCFKKAASHNLEVEFQRMEQALTRRQQLGMKDDSLPALFKRALANVKGDSERLRFVLSLQAFATKKGQLTEAQKFHLEKIANEPSYDRTKSRRKS